jgi:uncharacterized membrane protein (DUF106 family)
MVRDPDNISQDQEDREHVQDALRQLDKEIRNARDTGDFAKVERLEEERELVKKQEPC